MRADVAGACTASAVPGRAWQVVACLLSSQEVPRTATYEVRQETPCFFETKTLLLLLLLLLLVLHHFRVGRQLLERV